MYVRRAPYLDAYDAYFSRGHNAHFPYSIIFNIQIFSYISPKIRWPITYLYMNSVYICIQMKTYLELFTNEVH